jgi:hypothetical protein
MAKNCVLVNMKMVVIVMVTLVMVTLYVFFSQQNDAQLELERRGFYEQSMKYVLQLQEVQERKKFEFVEIVSRRDFVRVVQGSKASCGDFAR